MSQHLYTETNLTVRLGTIQGTTQAEAVSVLSCTAAARDAVRHPPLHVAVK